MDPIIFLFRVFPHISLQGCEFPLFVFCSKTEGWDLIPTMILSHGLDPQIIPAQFRLLKRSEGLNKFSSKEVVMLAYLFHDKRILPVS